MRSIGLSACGLMRVSVLAATPRRERPSTRRTRGAFVRTCRTCSVRATVSCLASQAQSTARAASERHREVEDGEAREVVEEVRALAGLGVHLGQRRLDDPARPGDLVPAHRDAEPGVARAPAAEADEQVGPAGLDERRGSARSISPAIAGVSRASKVVRLDVDDVPHLVAPVAERGRRGHDRERRGEVARRRPPPSPARRAAAAPAGSRGAPAAPGGRDSANSISTGAPSSSSHTAQQPPQRRHERQLVPGEDRGEVEDARPGAPRAGDEPVGLGVVGRGRVAQRAVRLGLGEARGGRGTPSRPSGRRAAAGRRSRPRTRDCVASTRSRTEPTGGGRFGWAGEKDQHEAAVHDRLAEAEGEVDDALVAAAAGPTG